MPKEKNNKVIKKALKWYEARRFKKIIYVVKFCTEFWTILKNGVIALNTGTDLCTTFDPLNDFFKRRASYHFKG